VNWGIDSGAGGCVPAADHDLPVGKAGSSHTETPGHRLMVIGADRAGQSAEKNGFFSGKKPGRRIV
jgi:hypothetical protein